MRLHCVFTNALLLPPACRAAEEQRRTMLHAVMAPDARERCEYPSYQTHCEGFQLHSRPGSIAIRLLPMRR